MLQHILVGLDGSPLAETVLPYVSLLAKRLGAEVTLLHVVHLPDELRRKQDSPAVDEALAETKVQVQAYLRRVEERLATEGVVAHGVVTVGEAAAEVVQYARQTGVDLIALATHGRSGGKRWLYGSVADKVLHTAATPLLFIRPLDEWRAAPPDLRRVIVPLDGSSLAESALPMAELMAQRFAVPIVLLRVVETTSLFGDMGIGGYSAIFQSLQEGAEGYLRDVALRLEGKGLTVQTVTSMDSPASAIAGWAHEHPGSLVVLTTHGRGGLVELVVGSVARRVMQQADAPVLVMRG